MTFFRVPQLLHLVKMECYLSGLHALLFTDWDILFNYVDYCELKFRK